MIRDLLEDIAPIDRTHPGNLLRGPLHGLPRFGVVAWFKGLLVKIFKTEEVQ